MNRKIIEWNRKEELPEQTIISFQKAFNSVGIETSFCSNTTHKGLWYSVTLYDKANNTIATRGKGVSEAFSEASACGEFSERLQGGWLYRVPEVISQYESNDNISCGTEQFLNKAFGDYSFLKVNKEQSIYYEITSKELVSIPDDLVMTYAGTNGLAAGNTREEAFVQGTCEIFERYVTKMIFKGDYEENDFPTLDQSLYKDLMSYKMLKEIEANGFICQVKDCSLNGMLPVIGLLVMDSSRNRYCFSLSSDFNLDIAMQRCITEIFQHFDMGIAMKLNMHRKLDSKNYWSKKIPNEEGFSRTLFNGTGQLPSWFLESHAVKKDMVSPIGYEKLTNSQCKKRIIDILKKHEKEIYIKDCSFLNIPALRIVIPGLSDIYWEGKKIDYSYTISQTLCLMQEKDKKEECLKQLYEKISLIFTLPIYEYECSWKKIYGPYFSVSCDGLAVDIYLFYASLCMKFGECEKAINSLRKSCSFSSNLDYHKISYYAGMIIYGMNYGYSLPQVLDAIGETIKPDYIKNIFYIITNPELVVGKIIIPEEEQRKLELIKELKDSYEVKMSEIESYDDALFL